MRLAYNNLSIFPLPHNQTSNQVMAFIRQKFLCQHGIKNEDHYQELQQY